MPRALLCPRDRTPLVAEPSDGVTVDRCPTCKGLWLDATEVTVVIDAAVHRDVEAPKAAWEAVRYANCPACSTQMARRNYLRVSGVIVDSCPRHGTWLDGGELERIATFLQHDGERKAKRAEERLRAEEKETRRDLDRLERAVRMSRPGRWSSDGIELLDVIDMLRSLRD